MIFQIYLQKTLCSLCIYILKLVIELKNHPLYLDFTTYAFGGLKLLMCGSFVAFLLGTEKNT